jgi:hypothetical protein
MAWHGIEQLEQLELHIQPDKYWFLVPRGPSWTFKRPKSPKIIEMGLKMGNVRLYLVKYNWFMPQMAWNR